VPKSFSESFVAPTSIATNDYHIAAVLDQHNTIVEEYKSNNTLTSSGTTHFEAPIVDLGATINPPTAISTKKKTKVSVTVTNHGNVEASGAGVIQLYASDNQSDLETLIATLPEKKFALKAGAGKAFPVTVFGETALAGSQEYLIAVVTFNGAPADDNSANNTAFSNTKVSFT
jgi:hypothetical protein